jgi:hypothetical protein
MKLSDETKALLFVLPALIAIGAANPTLWHGVFGRSKASYNLHLVLLCLSFISALASFLYFYRGKKISFVIGLCLAVNGLWLILLTCGLIFALAFDGPG